MAWFLGGILFVCLHKINYVPGFVTQQNMDREGRIKPFLNFL